MATILSKGRPANSNTPFMYGDINSFKPSDAYMRR